MPTAHSKYKLIYGRFIVVLAAFLAGYSFLHWWLVVRTLWDGPSLAVTHWILPAAIAMVLYMLFLRKRFHLLMMETNPPKGRYHKRKGQREFDKSDFSIVVIPLLAAPVIAAQFLLTDLTSQACFPDYTWPLHATWISTVASCLIILLVIVFSTDDREAWQQFEADKAYRKRNRITKQ